MSDPAVEAASRVWKGCEIPSCSTHNKIPTDLVEAAWQALVPVRMLHRAGLTGNPRVKLCGECMTAWPCATARLVYSAEELS